jgi:toxin ParE1/3/4
MEVRYTLRAHSDLEAIFISLGQRDEAAARTVKDFIRHRIERLADFPLIAPETDEQGVRELSVVRYPYKIYYEVESEEVRVLHIRDERRKPWREWRMESLGTVGRHARQTAFRARGRPRAI